MNRFLGCVSSAENERLAAKYGYASDRSKIEKLAAPWDATDKPAIINWSDEWKARLEKEADAMDIMRTAYKLPPVWEIAKQFGHDLPSLCMSIQRGNDCTAWGVSRAAVCLTLYQQYFGAEIQPVKYNPTGVYAFSSTTTPSKFQKFPDNGRTIFAIAEAAKEVGNFPVEAIGEYSGEARFTAQMISSVSIANENQMGFVYLGDEKLSPQKLADIVILSLRACRPVIIGNTISIKDGTALNQDGVYVSEVGGTWGGGHCTAACDVKKVGDKYYPWIYNSHGRLYPAKDGSPDEGTYITREDLVRYLSGTFADIMPTTYIERPRQEFRGYKGEANG